MTVPWNWSRSLASSSQVTVKFLIHREDLSGTFTLRGCPISPHLHILIVCCICITSEANHCSLFHPSYLTAEPRSWRLPLSETHQLSLEICISLTPVSVWRNMKKSLATLWFIWGHFEPVWQCCCFIFYFRLSAPARKEI